MGHRGPRSRYTLTRCSRGSGLSPSSAPTPEPVVLSKEHRRERGWAQRPPGALARCPAAVPARDGRALDLSTELDGRERVGRRAEAHSRTPGPGSGPDARRPLADGTAGHC